MVDGTPYTFLGAPDVSGPTLATQKSAEVRFISVCRTAVSDLEVVHFNAKHFRHDGWPSGFNRDLP